MIIVLGQGTGDYWVYQKDVGNTKYLELNKTTAAQTNSGAWNNTTPTDSVFTVGNGVPVNYSGQQYTAYLFADNDGDGEFGPTGDQDIIKCGSYTGDDLDDGPEIDLGFEPQWLMVKNTSTTRNWIIVDNMRGIPTGGNDANLYPNLSNAEDPAQQIRLTPTGFKCEAGGDNFNGNGHTMIYIAIRRGPMAVPESATDVFDVVADTTTFSPSNTMGGILADWMFGRARTADAAINWFQSSRLSPKTMAFNATGAEQSTQYVGFDRQTGIEWENTWSNTSGTYASWYWKRAPNFFDVVAYEGTGSNQTIDHNLGVAPKFMIVKERTTTNNWVCYLEALGNDKRMALNAASSVATDTTAWQSTTPTDSAFYVGANTQTNVSGEDFIAYLFGEVAGISKFGTYTGTGAAQNIDCGFSSGARFVLTKTYAGTNPNANWNVWDSERGIVAGNDPYLALNSTAAEVTSTDVIDPYSSGFSLTSSGVANNSGTSYWFYAIA